MIERFTPGKYYRFIGIVDINSRAFDGNWHLCINENPLNFVERPDVNIGVNNLDEWEEYNKIKEYKKPSLGLMPKFFYERQRIQEILRAINGRVAEDIQSEELVRWSEELMERIKTYNSIQDKMK
jgi:hypothetical protein